MTSINETEDLFNSWNPMKEDFTSPDFNNYTCGPGANLNLPCTSQGDIHQKIERPYLIFKRVPKFCDKLSLYNMCSRHGQVMRVDFVSRTQHYYVHLKSIADMEKVYYELSKSDYDLIITVGKQRKDRPEAFESETSKMIPMAESTEKVDIRNRTLQVSQPKKGHPYFNLEPLVSKDEYEVGSKLLLQNDVKHHYLNATYEHALERVGIFKTFKFSIDKECEYKYESGRAIINILDSIKSTVPAQNISNEFANVVKLIKFGHCVNCGRECDSSCIDCSTAYCCIYCQNADLSRHIIGAGKLPELLQVKPSVNEFNDNHMPSTRSVVIITAFEQSNIIYIRSKTNDMDCKYLRIINKINENSAKYVLFKEMPPCGQIVILKLPNECLRCIVLNNKDKDAIKLVCVDYGNIESQPLANLYEATDEVIKLPRYATPVKLKNVPNCFMRAEYRKLLYVCMDSTKFTVKYKSSNYEESSGLYEVDLIEEGTHLSLNKALLKLCAPENVLDTDGVFFYNLLQHAPFPTGKNVELIITDNSMVQKTGVISCTTEEYAREIEKFQKDLQVFGNKMYNNSGKSHYYAPRIDELCIAKYEPNDQWCRGRCLELVGDGFPTILFFDYGDIIPVSVHDIFRFPEEFLFPLLTTEFEIEKKIDFPFDDKMMPALITGSVLKCDEVVFNKKEDFYTIKISSVIEKTNIAEKLRSTLSDNEN